MANPPKPTNLRVLQGNPGKRALPKDEPQPDLLEKDAPPPEGMSDEAVRAWKEIVPLLVGMRIMTHADVPMIRLYCELWSEQCDAEKMLKEQGAVLVTESTGVSRMNPWQKVKTDAIDRRMKILSLFGMSPSDRTKVKAAPAPTKKSGFAP